MLATNSTVSDLFLSADKRVLRVARTEGVDGLNIQTDEEHTRNPRTR